jgi:hypothetical protein
MDAAPVPEEPATFDLLLKFNGSSTRVTVNHLQSSERSSKRLLRFVRALFNASIVMHADAYVQTV